MFESPSGINPLRIALRGKGYRVQISVEIIRLAGSPLRRNLYRILALFASSIGIFKASKIFRSDHLADVGRTKVL